MFGGSSVGRQCLANSTVFIVKSVVSDPARFKTEDLDAVLIEGDELYRRIVKLSPPGTIDFDGFLDFTHLDTVSKGLTAFILQYDAKKQAYGSLSDTMNAEGCGTTVGDALRELFVNHGGLFIANLKTFGLSFVNSRYYLFNSHECTAQGRPSRCSGSGTAVMSSCDSTEELAKLSNKHRDIRQTLSSRLISSMSSRRKTTTRRRKIRATVPTPSE